MIMKYLKSDSPFEVWTNLMHKNVVEQSKRDRLWQELDREYTKKNRHYHGWNHILLMLSELRQIKEKIVDIELMQFSIFYHDAIYSVIRKDNEEKSAALAVQRLHEIGFNSDRIDKCKEQILATKTHQCEENTDTAYLVDIDLGILGSQRKTYQQYIQNIRKEYSIYPDFMYRKGRKAVLQDFLARKTIYKTEFYRKRLELQARENLIWELEQ